MFRCTGVLGDMSSVGVLDEISAGVLDEISISAERQLFVDAIFNDTGMFGGVEEELQQSGDVCLEQRDDGPSYDGSRQLGGCANTEVPVTIEPVDA